MRRTKTTVAALALLVALVVAACSGGGSAEPSIAPVTASTDPSTTTTTTTRLRSTTRTTSSTSTAPSTTTSTTTTTVAPTTTLPPLPVPLDAPIEDGSTEPTIEIGSIEIPRIGLSRPMFEGIRLATLNGGPGHWPGTAMPGDLGNVVVAGHRVSHNQDFRNLDQLAAGDEVIMSTMSGRHVYRVVGTEIVQPDAIWIVDQTAAHTATLFACHPPGSVRERIVVHLELT